MRIGVLGLTLSSSWGNGHATTYRALLRATAARGHRIDFYEREQPWYAAHRDENSPGYCSLVFYRSLNELRGLVQEIAACDAVLLGSFVPEGIAVAEILLAAGIRPLAFYDIDTPVTLAAVGSGRCTYMTAELIPAFDAYLSFSGGAALDILARRHRARRVLALPCGVDAEAYAPVDLPWRWDLGYLGTYSVDRQPTLDRLLVEPAQRLPQCRFVVAGPQYPEDIDWPSNVDRIDHVAPRDHPAFYGALRFALNVTRADMVSLGHSPSVRLFEAGACATPVISDPWPGLEEFFEVGSEVLVAESSRDVEELLSGIESHRAADIGRAARERVLRDHHAGRRAELLEAALLEAAAARGPTRLSA
jgi:spore maturation protein CgeB